jgi:predicted nucleic acid-binding Zn ribbon protein
VARLPEHGHCENCGDPTPFGEHFCSDGCSDEYSKDVREARRLDNRFYILMGAAIVAVAVAAYAVKTFLLS